MKIRKVKYDKGNASLNLVHVPSIYLLHDLELWEL